MCLQNRGQATLESFKSSSYSYREVNSQFASHTALTPYNPCLSCCVWLVVQRFQYLGSVHANISPARTSADITEQCTYLNPVPPYPGHGGEEQL